MTGRPPHVPGRRVGLLGGSFDPAHGGHLHLSREALKRVGLDEVWWLVSPGNPLKSEGPAPLERRMARAREVAAAERRIRVTDLETQLGTRFTVDTLGAIMARYRRQDFVWLMGADNLAQVHLWRDWQAIFAVVPVAVFGRPGAGPAARLSPAARAFRFALRPDREARALPGAAPPAWSFIEMPLDPSSSTAIRRAGHWNRD